MYGKRAETEQKIVLQITSLKTKGNTDQQIKVNKVLTNMDPINKETRVTFVVLKMGNCEFVEN